MDRLRTDATLRRLCGGERAQAVPSESVFSRTFTEWADSGMLEQVQEKLVMVADLPKVCDRGVKIGSDGKKQRWTGYKLHGDISDNL